MRYTATMWKNKHVIIALIVAPILAILGWYAVGFLIGEKPQAAASGETYKLVARSNCRYASGVCGLRNADFVLDLTATDADSGGTVLHLVSAFPLEGVKVALASPGSTPRPPEDMKPEDELRRNWAIELPLPDPERDRLHLVASAGGTLYFGDAAMLWMTQDTSDPNDAR